MVTLISVPARTLVAVYGVLLAIAAENDWRLSRCCTGTARGTTRPPGPPARPTTRSATATRQQRQGQQPRHERHQVRQDQPAAPGAPPRPPPGASARSTATTATATGGANIQAPDIALAHAQRSRWA